MKDLVDLLAAYPLWVKLSVGGLWTLSAFLLIVFRPQLKSVDKPVVSISIGTNNSGIVAGRDVIMQGATPDARVEELVRILDLRAEKIAKDLAPEYRYAVVSNYLSEFSMLHKRHVDALRRGNVVEAHEILLEIHALSTGLESDEFWTRHHKETPDTRYMLREDAFLRGPVIGWYVGDALQDTLVAEALRDRYKEPKATVSPSATEIEKLKRFYQGLIDGR